MLNASNVVRISNIQDVRESTLERLLEKGKLIEATVLANIVGVTNSVYLSEKVFMKCFNPDATSPVEDDIKTFLSVCNAQQKVALSNRRRKDKLHFVYPLFQCIDGVSIPSATEVIIHFNMNDVVISLAEEKQNFYWL